MKLIFIIVGILGGLIAGLGGPGGLPVIGLLYSRTSLTTAELAGTSSAIFVFASLFASSMYYYSGDINFKIVLPLIPSALVGTALGTRINPLIPRKVFGVAIAILVTSIGISVAYREIKDLEPYAELNPNSRAGIMAISVLGLAVGLVGGIFGIGGPALSIPMLIFFGFPALQAIGAGLVQGIFVTSSTATNYVLSGDISSELAALIGVPYVMSQIAGWYTAQNIETRKLKIALGGMLAALGPYILTTV